MMMKSSNPALSEKNFSITGGSMTANPMTLNGTIAKSFLLIALVIGTGLYSYLSAFPEGWGADLAPQPVPFFVPALIIAFITSFVIIFKKEWAPYLAPLYAVCEGIALGSISATFEYRFPGIAGQAMISTCGVFVAMLLAYRSGLIRATDKFKTGVFAATAGIAVVYLVDMVLHMFGVNIPFIHSNGPTGILISCAIVAVAALNLILDFDFIDQASRRGLPKYMEWYSSFALLVTLVWLYMEILRLLGRGRGRD